MLATQQQDPPPPSADNLRWEDGRWHCGSKGIHAGTAMEMRTREGAGHYDDDGGRWVPVAGDWIAVRVESEDRGRQLIAFHTVQGIEMSVRVSPGLELRWP